MTADSIYYNNSHAGYNNCIGALVDGKFYPLGFADGSKCCAHTAPFTNTCSWFSIDMGAQTIVQTVLIINREEFNAVDDRIIGSDFYVGDSSLPFNNTPCNVLPTKSGAYSCGGKIGRYLGLYKGASSD